MDLWNDVVDKQASQHVTEDGSLDAWASEIERTLEEPDSMLYLARRLFRILAARHHVQSGLAKRIVTKNELLSRDSLCIIHTLIHHKKHAMERESGEQKAKKGELKS